MKVLHNLVCHFSSLQVWWQRRFNRVRFLVDVWKNGGCLKCSSGVIMNVPVRAIGSQGNIQLAEGAYGFESAPMMGDGRILLQARKRGATVRIGARAGLSNNISIVALSSVTIGDDFLCGSQVQIMDADFHEVDPERRRSGEGAVGPVTIGNNVWLGSNVIVQKGVSIGDHSIVASGSVVTKSIPSRVIAGGVPARVIKVI